MSWEFLGNEEVLGRGRPVCNRRGRVGGGGVPCPRFDFLASALGWSRVLRVGAAAAVLGAHLVGCFSQLCGCRGRLPIQEFHLELQHFRIEETPDLEADAPILREIGHAKSAHEGEARFLVDGLLSRPRIARSVAGRVLGGGEPLDDVEFATGREGSILSLPQMVPSTAQDVQVPGPGVAAGEPLSPVCFYRFIQQKTPARGRSWLGHLDPLH